MYTLTKVKPEELNYAILCLTTIKPYFILNEYVPKLKPFGLVPSNCIISPISGYKIENIRHSITTVLCELQKEDKDLKIVVLGSKLIKELNLTVGAKTLIEPYSRLYFYGFPLISPTITDSRQYFEDVVHYTINQRPPLGKYTISDTVNERLISTIESADKGDILSIDIETNYKLGFDSYIVSIAFEINDYRVVIKNIAQCVEELKKILKIANLGQLKLLFHRASFDIKIMIYNLYMDRSFNIEGLLEGLKIFEHVEDSKVLCYLHKNSSGVYRTGLKVNTFKYLGDYGLSLSEYDYSYTGSWANKDMVFPNLPNEFYTYNILDAVGTKMLYEELMLIEHIKRPYMEIFRPSIIPLVKMMLVGLPIDLDKVEKLKKSLLEQKQAIIEVMLDTKVMKEVILIIRQEYCDSRNAQLKTKTVPLSDFDYIQFNPNSSKNLTTLMFTYLDLPKYFKTVKGKDSVDKDNIKYALANLDDWEKEGIDKEEVRLVLNTLLELSDMKAVITTFIPAFEDTKKFEGLKGIYFLRGDLNLGGTVSGRLSSSNPNLQNLPSNSEYGASVKDCFVAPEGWLIASSDYSSLEHRVKTIQTQSTNLKNIYLKGFDAHSFNAFNYFPEKMPDVVAKGSDVSNINTIEKLYPKVRYEAKAPTFLLFYGGTSHGLHSKSGFTEEKALEIEEAFHNMYPEINELQDKNMEFVEEHKYLPLAFGHRMKTAYIGHNIKGLWNIDNLKEKESKSVGNAFSQSWGLLINRAINEVEEKLKYSKFTKEIIVINTIHDAVYYLIKRDVETVKYLNDVLIEAMNWNSDPKIYDKDIKIEAEMCIGTTWLNSVAIRNNASTDDIDKIMEKL